MTRRQLLVAATQVFAEEGDAGRLEDVAAAVGVAKSALFRHWSSKEDLVAEVRLRVAERHRGWIEHAVAHHADDPMTGVVEATVGFFAPQRNALFDPLVTRGALAEPPAELDALAPMLDAIADRVGPDARELVDSVALGTTRGWLGTPGLADLDVDRDQLAAVLRRILAAGLDGIGPLPVTGRRPRRPAPAPFGAAGDERSRKEAAILDAALGVFATSGYDRARLEDVAAAAGTTASALFTYWPGKEALFVDLRSRVTATIAAPLLDAVARPGTPTERLRAAVAANIAAHYERPEFQSVLLPVPSLPPESELESVGWIRTIEALDLIPGIDRAGDLVPVITAIGLTVLRLSVLTMHRLNLHPALVTSVAGDYLAAGITAAGADLGVDLGAGR